MGKSQKKRAIRRHNPMRVPDTHLPKGLASASSSSSKTEAILPIIQKMESVDVNERKWACVAVSNIIQNDPSTRRLLQGKNIVGALISRLTDSEEEVVVEAAGTLRNLCIDGGYDICAEMYNKNILTPLKSFIPKISSTLAQYLESPTSAPENARTLIYTFADNVITIMWCLSETSNKALNAINEVNLVPFLMSFIAARDKLPLSTVNSAAQCLYVLTDDNYPTINEVRSHASYTAHLLAAAKTASNIKGKGSIDDKSVMLSVLSSGILRNISPLPPLTATAAVDVDKEVALPLLQSVLNFEDLSEVSPQALGLISQLSSAPEIQKSPLKGVPKSDHRTNAEIQLEQLEGRLRTMQLAIEILTGLCATLPDPNMDPLPEDEDVDADENDIAEEEDAVAEDDEMAVDDEEMDVQTNEKPHSLPVFSMINQLLALIQPTPLSFPPHDGPSPYPPITAVLSTIHIGALECLNNIFLSLAASPSSTVSDDIQTGTHIWHSIWSALGSVGTVFGQGQEKREEMWKVAVGVLWGVGIAWKQTLVPDQDKVQTLIQYSHLAPDVATRVKCIGALECVAQHPSSIGSNRVISDYLISLLPTSQGPSSIETEPLIQAVSALIDIYSDEDLPYDVNFRQGGYLGKLVDSVEGLRKAIKGIDKKREGGKDLKRRGDEVRENLIAFVKYRRNLKL